MYMEIKKAAKCKINISYEETQEINLSVKEILEKINFDKEYEIKDILIEKEKKDKNITFLIKLKDKDKKSNDKSLDKYINKKN